MNDYDFSEVFKQADALVREQDQDQAQAPAPASETAPSEPVKSAGNDRIGKFIDAYLPAAQKKAQELGVSPVALLAQAALETGYGKSVIPGTNNLFNIKDFSGKGVAATDNMTGSRDKYRAYGSPDESFNDHASLLSRRYKGALNTGDDVAGYFSALKKGGYAEDPNYVTSGVNVANVIRARLGDLGKYQGGQADTSAPQEQQARPSRYGEYDPSVDASASAADQQFVTESRQRASDASPISTSLKRGWNQMTDSVGNAYDLAKGNDEGVINRMREADERERLSPQPTANRAWMDSWQKGDTLGWLGNPMGFAGNSVEQLANSAPPMVGSIPGSIVGGAAGASVAGPFGALLGGVIGGAIGSAPGSVAIETGSRIAEMMANDGVDPSNTKMVRDWLSANREKVLREGTIKGLTTAGFDGLMGGIGQRIVAGPMLRFTQASERTLAKMGVDMTDKAAVKAATALPAYKAAMAAPAAELKAATVAAGNAIRGVAEFAGESAGEGLGEYYGEKFATGKGNVDEALLETLMAHGQALVTTAASFAGRKIVGDKYHDQEKAYIDALAAYKAPAQPQPNSPLTNAANAGSGPGAASPQAPAQAFSFGDPDLDAKHQAIADFLATPGNLDALRNADPNMVGEALHVWRNVINNPNLPLKTRINALNQGYSTLLNVPNFTMPGAQPGAAPTGNLPVPAAGGRPAPVGGTQVGPVDPSAGSIPGQATRVPDAPQSLPRTALPRPMVGAPTQEQPNGASPVIPRPEIPEAAAPSAEAQGTDVPASGIAVQPAVPSGGTGLPGTVEPEVVPQAQEGATAGNAAGEQAAPVAAPRPAPQKDRPSPIMARDDIVGAIMRVTGGAGIASKMADTLTGEKAGQGTAKLRGLFTNAGWQDMDKLAEMLRDEEGYDVRDAAHMEDLIRRAAAGDFVRSMARTEKDKAEEADKQHRDEIRRMAAKLGVKTNFVKFGDIEAKVLALMEQRHAKAIELLDSRSRAKFDATLEAAEALLPEDVIEAVMVDVNRRGVHGRDFWNECTKTLRGMIRDAQLERIDESVENAVEGEAPAWLEEGDEQGDQQPGGGSAVDQGNEAEPAEVAGSGSAEEVAPSFDLAGQTPDEILAEQGRQIVERERQRREAQNERDREKRAENRKEQERRAAAVIAEREAAKKAEVDALANNFALGQEAPAPVEKKVSTEEAAGQKDIFASPAPANEEFARGQAMFAEGIDELISLLGGKTNMLPEEETRLLPIMSKILRGAAVMGYESFKDAARFVINTLREKAPDVADKLEIKNLQAGYINLNGFDPKSGIGDFASIDELMADHDALVESVEKAEKHTDTNPSPAQKEAENYRTGKFQWQGLTISVETAKGQDRTDKETNGEKWRVTMPATYGRILGTTGADEDHVDVFVGPNLLSPKVFVIDQNQVDSKIFDEHKTFIGYDTAEQAQADYLNSFTGTFGGRVFGQISDAITVDELKAALPALQEKKPFTEPAPAAAAVAPSANPLSEFEQSYRSKTDEAKAEYKQTLADMIETNKELRKPYQHLADRLALAKQLDSGGKADASAVYSNPVEGHPENNDYPLLRNLVPYMVNSVADAERKVDYANRLYSEANGKLAKAEYALRIAKTPAQKKAAKAEIARLRDKEFINRDAVDALRNETLPELNRIYNSAQERFGEQSAPAVAESAQKAPDSESVVALPKPDRTEIVAERIEQTSTGVKVFGPNLDDLADRARSIYGKGVVKRKDGITIATKDPASAKGVFPLRNEFYTLPGLPERYAPIKVAVYEDGAQVEGVNFGYVSQRVPNIADAIEQYRKGYESNPEKSESATAEDSSGVAETAREWWEHRPGDVVKLKVIGGKPIGDPLVVSAVDESDQERSWREWGENYSRVAGAPDLAAVDLASLERAEAYANRAIQSEKRKGWDGGEINQTMIDAFQREADFMKAELSKRRSERDQRYAQPAAAVAPAPEEMPQIPAATPLASFSNGETGMSSMVVSGSKEGTFNVVLRDDDSGEYVPTAVAGFDTMDKAIAKARQIVGLPAEDTEIRSATPEEVKEAEAEAEQGEAPAAAVEAPEWAAKVAKRNGYTVIGKTPDGWALFEKDGNRIRQETARKQPKHASSMSRLSVPWSDTLEWTGEYSTFEEQAERYNKLVAYAQFNEGDRVIYGPAFGGEKVAATVKSRTVGASITTLIGTLGGRASSTLEPRISYYLVTDAGKELSYVNQERMRPYDAALLEEKPAAAPAAEPAAAPAPSAEKPLAGVSIGSFKHTRTGVTQYAVAFKDRVERDVFDSAKAIASRYKARYSSFRGQGAIPGFLFEDEAKAKKFAAEMDRLVHSKGEAKPVEPATAAKPVEQNATPEVADNEVFRSPYIYRKELNGWTWRNHGTPAVNANSLKQDAPIIAELERDLEGRKPKQPKPKKSSADALLEARNDLIEMQSLSDSQFIADDRLLERIRRQKRYIADLEKDAAPAAVDRTPEEYQSKAASMFAAMDDNAKIGVRNGLFPAPLMAMAEREGYADSSALSSALMDAAKRDRAKPAAIENAGNSAIMESKEIDNANAIPESVGNDGQGVSGERAAGDVPQDEGGRGTGRRSEDAGEGGRRVVHGSERGNLGQGTEGDRSTSEDRPAGENPVHGDAGKPDRRGSAVSNARLHKRGNGAGGRDYLAPEGSLTRKGSWLETAKRNVEIIKLVKKLDSEGRMATPEEQAVIAQYVGFGASEMANGLFPLKTTWVSSGRWLGRTVTLDEVNESALKPGWKEVYYDLKESVSDEDMKAIRSSTQFAHFTSEKVIRSIWSAVNQLGFDGGKIVEPGMGTGLFMVASPEGMAAASKYVGIERDYVTASIAKHLLQAQNVIRNDFIAQNLPDGHFDLAIGNPPFASWEVTADPRYRKNRFKLHDYFFAKTIDKVRPGGLLVFVTSKGTMDKLDDKARSFLAERADLVGAVRLPQTAFKGNAGTEVVTDVIFLKKRAVGAGPSGPAWAGMKEVSTPQGPTLINEYFADHPEMVLGRHELTGTMYRSNQYTVVPMDGDIEEHFAQAVTNLPKGIYEPAQEKKEGATKAEQEKSDRREFDVGGKKEGGLYVAEDGELMQVVNGVGEPLSNTIPLTDKDRVWLKGYVGLRDALKTAMRDQLSDGDWQKSLAVLQNTYAAFTAKHGRIFEHTRYERTFADEAGDEETRVYRRFKWNHLLNSKVDVEVTLMNGLEDISETSEEVTDGDVIKGRVLARRGAAEINTIDDAFAVTLNDLGHLDIPRIASLMNVSEEEATGLLGDLVYEDPVAGWQTADEYLSGNVLKKLEEAEVAASTDPRFERNVQALIAAQPAPLGPDRIVVRLGANWIGPHVVTQFTDEAFEEKAKVTYDPRTNIWRVEGETLRRHRTAGAEWGTSDRSMPEILSAVLNNQSITVRRTDQNKKTYTDKEATAKANDIAEKMRQRFASWVWTDAARTDELLTIYNRKFNNLAPRKFDGKHMKLPGLSLRYSLYDHQLRAIWRIVQTGNSYLAHAVGAGKAQPLDAKVLTPTGWRLMGDIQPGDYVIAGDGTPTLVEAVFPQGEKEIFRITFSDGSNTECCDEHLWMTQTYKERGYAQKAKKAGKEWACAKGKIRSLAEIRETLVSDHLGAKNHSIPMVGAVQFQTSDLPLDPYLMGVLLGDGSMSAQHISISSGDPQIIELCAPLLPQNAVFNVKKGDGCPTWNIARKKAIGYGANMEPNPVVHVLRSLGLQGRKSADKFIPDAYKMASVEQRIAVLQGLLDTDGSVSKRGHSVYFYTVSDSLADDVQFIVRSLGGTVSRAVKKSPSFMHNGEKRTGQPCHVMCLKLPSDIAPFRISRKAELHRPKTSYGPVRYIVNVEPVGKKQAQCIRVDHPEHLYVTDDFIVTHNTLEMIVSAMEQKRLGLINKPMFVVPNHMLDQFANEFQSAYPAARILVADNDNFTGDARRRFVAKAALNDWDAIIIKQSSFGLIGIQQSTADSVADDILMELDAALDDTDEDDRVTRKKLEAQIDSVRQRVNALAGQGDKNITFEEMGVDFLYIDEAHQFRKLDFATNRQVKGIDPNGSKGAFGLFAKMRFLESKHAGRSAVLASGTPITNTIAELYTIQRYLDYTGLEEDGMVAFDAWANNYGAVAFEWERNAAAEFEKVERFSKFVNVPELMMRVRKFMDVLTMEQLGDFVTRPAVNGGGPEMVTAQKSEALEKYMREDLLPRLQASKAWKPSKDEPFNPDPVIAIGTDGRLAAIDARFADKSLKDDPGSKLNLMIDDIIAEYKATNGNVYTTDGKPDRIDGGAQIVFSSVGFGDAVEQNRGFSPRKWMMKRLKDAGIPSSEVAFMGDYKTDKQKEAMFKDMREGRKRILVGSPANMGTGVNVQKRLTKLHFLAPPWYPADVEQPHGRILRQGNENKEVGLRWYLTEGTYDSTMWGMVRRKGRAIEQAFRGDGARTIEDISEVSSYAMAEAVSAGDDRVIKLAEAQATVEKYQRLKNAHFSEQRQLRYDVSLNESRASWARKQILGLDESKRLQAEANFKYWEPLPVTIDNVTVNKAGDIGAKIGTQIAKVFADGSAGEHVIGKVLGTFDLVADLSPAAINNSEKDEVSLSLRVGPTELTIDDSCSLGLWAMKDEVGLGQKIKNAMVRVGERLNEAQRDLEDAESKLKKQRSRIGAPFSDDAALAQAIADAATIQAELVGESVKKQQDRANGAKAAAPAAKPNEAGKDDGETPSALRRSPDANAERIPFGVDAPTANTVVSRLFSALGTSLPNTVVDSFHELPDEVQAEARAQGGDAKTTKGVFHRGTVYFVANNHDSIADLEETVLHEAIGHAGLRKLLGPEFVQKLNALFASLGGISGLSKIAAENGFGSIYDEYIRSVADAQAKDPAKYTDAIAKLILTEEVFAHIAQNRPTLMSKVKALIGWVRDWLRSHGFAKLAEYGETDVLNLLNRVKKNLRDPNGDGPKGGNFDAEAAPTVLRRSPMEAARDFVTTPEGRKKITERIADIFRKTGTFNVWHKTFGSQFHKAKIDADFRPVYELAQKYHDDISRFAVEAADMAPDLLPKLDKVSDAIRGFANWSRDTKDAKAISEAIFTGTLEDEKVYSDRELADRFNLDERQVGLYRQYRAAVDRSMDDLAKAEMAKLAKTAGIEEAPKDLSVDESSSYYIDQLDGAIQEAEDRVNLLGKLHADQLKALEVMEDIDAYNDIRDALNDKQAADMKYAQDKMAEVLAMRDGFAQRAARVAKMKQEGYAPLMRFGKYTVDVVEVDADGNEITYPITAGPELAGQPIRHFFSMFESKAEAAEAAKMMREEYPTAKVTEGIASEEAHTLFSGVNPGTIEMLAQIVGAEDEVMQRYLKMATASRSAMKRLIHRKKIAGHSEDVTRTLASFIVSNARAASASLNFGGMLEAANAIPKEKGDVKDEAVKLINYIRNPQEEASGVRGLLFAQYIGGSLASALVNLTQTATTTFPFLHQFGGTVGDLMAAAKMAGGKALSGKFDLPEHSEIRSVIQLAEEEGVLSPHNIHALMGESVRPGLLRNRFMRNFMHLWGAPFSMAESFNREVAFIAAFNVAKRNGNDREAAYQFAKNAVEETQFVYSKASRPNWARGAVGATLFTFKSFSVFYIELMKRLPAKERAIMMATMILLAGVGGLPAADDLDDLVDTLGQRLGYDTNSKRAKDEFARRVLGKTGAEFLLNGVSAFLPMDVQRLGMGNLIPGSSAFKRSETDRSRDALEFFGAAGSQVKALFDSVDYATNGQAFKAVTNAIGPKALKDAFKGAEMADTGIYTDTKGRRVADVTMGEAAMKAIGFQPSSVKDIQEQKSILMQDVNLAKEVRSAISELWAQGRFEKDQQKVAKAKLMLEQWNARNPDTKVQVNVANVQRRVHQMELTAAERMRKAVPKTMKQRAVEAFE